MRIQANRLLKIDLSNRRFEIEEIPGDIIRKYIGGRGLGSHLLYNLVPPKTDPLGEENHVIFTAGPANGTDLFYSSKVCLSTKSPLTGIYLFSISSSILGHEMAKAGFCAIDIEGIAESPTYIIIDNQKVEFRDAGSLWGMETAAAQQAMLGGSSPRKAATVAIGTVGEQLVKYAAVFSQGTLYRCFGRGGGGAVMGSKKLKGFVIHGDGKIQVPDRDRYEVVKRKITDRLMTDAKAWADRWRRYETAADLKILNQEGILPTRNWQNGQFDSWWKLDKSTTPGGWPEGGRPCALYCPTPGCRNVEVKEGPYKGAQSDIEWEAIYAFGTHCGVDKIEAVIAAGQICDEFGVDIMSAGITIGFAMECFERGLIGPGDTDGIELRFGNDAAMIAALRKITAQEGFGKELSKGTKRLSEDIKGSESFAMHAKGLELGGYECRGLNGQALQFAISTIGGSHHAYGIPARKEIFDGTRLDIEGKGKSVRDGAIGEIVRDSIPVCIFPRLVLEEKLFPEILTALSEKPWSAEELNQAGERVMCQERLFNVREGLTRKDDTLPGRLLNEPKADGPTKGAVVPMEQLKDDFYTAMGYDLSTGNPTDSTLSRLGIKK